MFNNFVCLYILCISLIILALCFSLVFTVHQYEETTWVRTCYVGIILWLHFISLSCRVGMWQCSTQSGRKWSQAECSGGSLVASVMPGHMREPLRLLAGNEGKRRIPIRSFITHGECSCDSSRLGSLIENNSPVSRVAGVDTSSWRGKLNWWQTAPRLPAGNCRGVRHKCMRDLFCFVFFSVGYLAARPRV